MWGSCRKQYNEAEQLQLDTHGERRRRETYNSSANNLLDGILLTSCRYRNSELSKIDPGRPANPHIWGKHRRGSGIINIDQRYVFLCVALFGSHDMYLYMQIYQMALFEELLKKTAWELHCEIQAITVVLLPLPILFRITRSLKIFNVVFIILF